jgi:nucleoid DNA-binding protein
VITHQFDGVHDALKTNNSVELSGFGKFIFNKKKAKKHVSKLEDIKLGYEKMIADENTPEKKLNYIKSKLSRLNLNVNVIKTKIR